MSDPVGQYLQRYPRGERSTVPPARAGEFRQWLSRNQVTDLDNPQSFYDYRGAFLAGVDRGPNGHWPDTYKQHGHPTFSVESQYAAPDSSDAGHWQGEQFVPPTPRRPDQAPVEQDPVEAYTQKYRSGEQAAPAPSFGETLRRAARIGLEVPLGIASGYYATRAGQEIAKHPVDIVRQGARGLAESGLATARGVEKFLVPEDYTPGYIDMQGQYHEPAPKPRQSTTMQRVTEEVRDFYGEPESTAGVVAGVAGRVTGDVAQFMAPGAALQAMKVATPATLLGRIGLQVATGAPITASIAAAGPEQSTVGGLAELTHSKKLHDIAQNPATRIGFDVALDAVLAGVGEGVATIVRRAKAAREAAAAVGKGDWVARFDELANEAAQLSIVKERTPQQTTRLRQVMGEMDELGKNIPPPIPFEQSAASQPPIPEPLAADLTERERRRYPVVDAGNLRRRATDVAPAVEAASPAPATATAEAPHAPAVAASPEVSAATIAPVGERSPRFAKMDDAALEERYAQIMDRMQSKGMEAWEGSTPWVRKEEGSRQYGGGGRGGFGGYSRDTGVRTGTAVTNKAGRAIGRMKDDARIAGELEAEFAARGLNHDDVLDRYLARPSPQEVADAAVEREAIRAEGMGEMGGARPRLVRLLARAGIGGAAGGVAGSQFGDTPAERQRNAVLFALAGAGLAAGGPELVGAVRGTKGIVSAAPGASREAANAFVESAADIARRSGAGVPAASAIEPDRYVNVSKFALDPAGEQRLRDEVVQVVQTEGLHPKQRVTWAETKRMAAMIGLNPSDLLQREAMRLSGPEMLAIRNIVGDNVTEIERLTRTLAGGPMPAEESQRLSQMIALREQQNNALLSHFTRGRTQAGRDLNSMKILARRTGDPVVWLAKARDIAGEAGFTLDVQTKVRRLLEEGRRPELVQYLATLRQAPWWEKLTTLWKAGLLTNPKTHIVNVASNTTMAALETMKDTPAVLFDRLLALATGNITKGRTSLQTITESIRGAREGLHEAKQVLRGVPMSDALSKFDIPKETHFDNAILETYTQTVFRTLDAEDRVFRGAALRRSLAEQAQVLAKREGLRGQRAGARISELLSSPPDEMVLQAVSDAEIATFRDETAFSRAARGFRHLGVLGEILLPFRRTPSAVATRVLEYSPLGFAKGGWEAWQAATKGKAIPAAQRRAAEILGRATTGTAAVALGWLLAENGLATGAAPTLNARDREQWKTEGKQPNSILLGGEWRNVGRLSPFGNLMALGANLNVAQHANQTSTWPERAGELAAATAKTVFDQPFLTGLKGATEALTDPQEAGGRFLTNTAASVVPAGVAAVARASDPVVRKPGSVLENIESRIPGLSRRVRPARDVFGAEAQREPGVIANILDPTSPSPDRRAHDPLVAEMSRVGAGIAPIKKLPDETPDEFDARQVLYGQRTRARLERLVGSVAYRYASSDRQSEMIEDAVADIRRTLSRHLSKKRSIARHRADNAPAENH